MQVDLSGKTALVTGGNSGIGRAISLTLARCGADVALTYFSTKDDKTINEVKNLGQRAIMMQLDATNSAEVKRAVDIVADEFDQHIDILINNAGHLIGRCRISDMEDKHWQSVIDVNLNSAFYVTRSVLPYMKRGWGRVVSISSLAAHTGGGAGNVVPYAVAKAALIAFMKGLAVEEAERGITANTVAPGLILDTPWHEKFSSEESIQKRISQTPLKRGGTPDEVVGAVLYLVSDMASFVTGEVIEVNGGRWFR